MYVSSKWKAECTLVSWILARTRLAISQFPFVFSPSKGIVCVNTTLCCSHRNQFTLHDVIYFNIWIPKILWTLMVRSHSILCINVYFLFLCLWHLSIASLTELTHHSYSCSSFPDYLCTCWYYSCFSQPSPVLCFMLFRRSTHRA